MDGTVGTVAVPRAAHGREERPLQSSPSVHAPPLVPPSVGLATV